MKAVAFVVFLILIIQGLRDARWATALYMWQAVFRPHEFPFGLRGGPGMEGLLAGPPWNLGMLGVMLLSWVLHARQMPPRFTKIMPIMTLNIVILCIACLLGQNTIANQITLQAIVQKAITFYVFCFVACDPERWQFYVRAFAISLGLTGVTGFVNQVVLNGYSRFDHAEILGPGGDISDRNDFAMNLAIACALLVPVALGENRWIHRLAYFAMAGMSAVLVLMTGSRGGALGLVLAMTYALARLHHKRWFVVMSLVGGLALAMQLPPSFYERIFGVKTAATADPSAMGRICAWRAAVVMAKRHNFGIGPGAWSSRVKRYELDACPAATAAHSHVYGMLGEAGYPGAIVWVLVMVAGFYYSYRAEKRIVRAGQRRTQIWYHVVAVRCGFLPFAFSGMFLSCQYHETFFMLMCCCGVADSAAEMLAKRVEREQEQERKEEEEKRRESLAGPPSERLPTAWG